MELSANVDFETRIRREWPICCPSKMFLVPFIYCTTNNKIDKKKSLSKLIKIKIKKFCSIKNVAIFEILKYLKN